MKRNDSEKSIMKMIDYVSSCKRYDIRQQFFDRTLEALRKNKNDRLWFKVLTKAGNMYLATGEFSRLLKVIRQLRESCLTEDGTHDPSKGTQLLEIYALEIQMYTVQKNNKKLKKLYERSLHVQSAIPHPQTMGIIRECGGKMHLGEESW